VVIDEVLTELLKKIKWCSLFCLTWYYKLLKSRCLQDDDTKQFFMIVMIMTM